MVMFVLLLTIAGFVVLAATMFIATSTGKRAADGARIFIWLWLVASLINGAYGFFGHSIPLINEVGAFIVIFGAPAAVAWFVSKKFTSET
jgi:hypothetical protein